MLRTYFTTYEFSRLCQGGLYLDFFTKNCAEVFLRNFFLYAALFFGEKYMIEFFTKFFFKFFVTQANFLTNLKNFTQSSLFLQLITFFSYSLATLWLIIL